jgi:predicted XRE-type DNA-binding protein
MRYAAKMACARASIATTKLALASQGDAGAQLSLAPAPFATYLALEPPSLLRPADSDPGQVHRHRGGTVSQRGLCAMTPEQADLAARSGLMTEVKARAKSWKAGPLKMARRLGISPERLDDLLEGRVAAFSSDELRAMAQKAGVRRYE